MKKLIPVLIVLTCAIGSACYFICEEITTGSKQIVEESGIVYEELNTKFDSVNREIIAGALNTEKDARNIQFILSSLNTANIGKIQKVKLLEKDEDKILSLISESGNEYLVYLAGTNTVEAIKDVTNDVWLAKSER